MSINFPDAPTTNQTYTFGSRTWKYNGSGWVSVVNVSDIDPLFIAGV